MAAKRAFPEDIRNTTERCAYRLQAIPQRLAGGLFELAACCSIAYTHVAETALGWARGVYAAMWTQPALLLKRLR